MKKEKKSVIEVPEELRKMAVEIACMAGPLPRPVDEVLMRAEKWPRTSASIN